MDLISELLDAWPLLWKRHGGFGPTPAFSPAPESKGVL